MGIITDVQSNYDEGRGVQRVFVRTKFGINNRSALNRVASRATVVTGVGQRSLVAAAYDEEGISLVWNDGPFGRLAPEDKFEDAKEIDYKSIPMERASELGDIFPGYLQEAIEFGEFMEGEILHVWTIPFDVGGRRM